MSFDDIEMNTLRSGPTLVDKNEDVLILRKKYSGWYADPKKLIVFTKKPNVFSDNNIDNEIILDQVQANKLIPVSQAGRRKTRKSRKLKKSRKSRKSRK